MKAEFIPDRYNLTLKLTGENENEQALLSHLHKGVKPRVSPDGGNQTWGQLEVEFFTNGRKP